MNLAATAVLSLAMSTDAFAAAVGKGAALHKPNMREALRTGLIFGIIEGVTPIIGWALGQVAAPYVSAWDHWIAFVLLGVLGLRMIWAGLSTAEADVSKPASHSFWVLAIWFAPIARRPTCTPVRTAHIQCAHAGFDD